jgi:hypothetical protein
LIKSSFTEPSADKRDTQVMLEATQPLGANRTDDPTVAMQRIIDRAMELVPSAGALTSQDEAALARLRAFISTSSTCSGSRRSRRRWPSPRPLAAPRAV